MVLCRRFRHAPQACLYATLLAVTGWTAPAWADGILEGISGDLETVFSRVSSKTTDALGTTTKTESDNYNGRLNLRLNYNLFPKLNLNAGGSFEGSLTDPKGETAAGQTETTRLRPYIWLTLRDPVLDGALGYEFRDETVRISSQPGITISRESYNANLTWRPADLPSTQIRFTQSATHDDERAFLDAEDNYVSLKSEYLYKGLSAYYYGTYLSNKDNIRHYEGSQLANEGKLLYSTSFLDDRVSVTSDNRVRFTEIDTTTSGLGQVPLFLPALAGFSIIDNTPTNDPLPANPTLNDGNQTISAGPNIGTAGGFPNQQNLGLDLGAAMEVNSLLVWVNVDLSTSPVVANSFTWSIYSAPDNIVTTTWTLRATVPGAPFRQIAPNLQRFEISFPNVTTRYIKVVVQALSPAVPGAAAYPDIFVTELQAFLNRPAAEIQRSTSQVFQNYNLDIKAILFRSPSLYYSFNGFYYQFDPNGQTRYNLSNGLFFTHRFSPIFSTSANASIELGKEREEQRTAFLYYASLAATPLKTLTSNLVFNGNNERIGEARTTSNSVLIYNTAQLYQGIEATLNLGAVFSSDDPARGSSSRRRDLYVNLGTGIVPHPSFTMTVYYLGKLSHASGGGSGGSRNITENRLDLGLSFTPFRTLVLSANVNIASQTGQETTVLQNYGATWAPFPDGSLQFSFYYSESYFPGNSRIIQPSLRWYLGPKRRSYLEASYQYNVTENGSAETASQVFSTSLRLFF